jgi:hypothetical protein
VGFSNFSHLFIFAATQKQMPYQFEGLEIIFPEEKIERKRAKWNVNFQSFRHLCIFLQQHNNKKMLYPIAQ